MAAPYVTTAKLFRKKLATLNDAPPIFWENVNKRPAANTVHLRPRLIPVESQLLDVTRRQSNPGIYSIGVYVPIGKGEKELLTIMDNIYNLFQSVFNLIEDDFLVDLLAISRSGIRRDENYCMANVDIRFINYN